MLIEYIEAELREVKKKEVKCPGQAGNPFHSKATGKFVDPDKEAGSWSHREAPAGKKCRGQSSRNSANRKQSWTKVPCGRKSKYKCHKGEPKWKRDDDLEEGYLLDYPTEPNKDRYGTKKRASLFPGTDELRKLGNGILEELDPVLEELFVQELLEQPEQRCFSPEDLKKYKQRIVSGLWAGISNYQKAAKGEF